MRTGDRFRCRLGSWQDAGLGWVAHGAKDVDGDHGPLELGKQKARVVIRGTTRAFCELLAESLRRAALIQRTASTTPRVGLGFNLFFQNLEESACNARNACTRSVP